MVSFMRGKMINVNQIDDVIRQFKRDYPNTTTMLWDKEDFKTLKEFPTFHYTHHKDMNKKEFKFMGLTHRVE